MFANTLKKLRKAKGLTQRQLADILFIDCSSVTKWETGKANPDFEKQKKLADFFNVSIDYLVGRTDMDSTAPHQSTENTLPPSEQELLNKYRSLDDSGKTKADEYLSDLAKLQVTFIYYTHLWDLSTLFLLIGTIWHIKEFNLCHCRQYVHLGRH